MSTSEKTMPQTKLVRDLAKVLRENDLNEIEFENETYRVRLLRGGDVSTKMPVTQNIANTSEMALTPTPESSSPPITDPAQNPNCIKSPLVGTAYLRPNPDSDAFITLGAQVKAGDTVLLIEAMKTFNSIQAPKSGIVEKILIEDSQSVEFNQPLIIIS